MVILANSSAFARPVWNGRDVAVVNANQGGTKMKGRTPVGPTKTSSNLQQTW